MTVSINSLEWSNWFSYGPDNKLEFEPGVTQLVGKNGHGKSSIALIVQEVLLGTTSKSIKKSSIINRGIKEPATAKLRFSKGNTSYLVDYKRTESKLTLRFYNETTGEELTSHKAADTYKLIAKTLNVENSGLLLNLVYQSSKSGLDLLTATDSRRLQFLKSLFNFEEYDNILARIKAKVKDKEAEYNKVKGAYDSYMSLLEHSSTNESYMEVQEEVDYSSEKDRLNKVILEIEGKLSKFSHLDKLNKLKAQVQNLRKEKESAESNLPQESKDSLKKTKQEIQSEKSSIENELYAEKKSVSTISTVLTKAASGEYASCPTCFREMDNSAIESLKSSKSEHDSRIKELEEALASTKDRERSVNSALECYSKYEKASASLSSAESNLNSLEAVEIVESRDDLLASKEKAQKDLQDIVKQEESIKRHNKEAIKHNSKIETLFSQKKDYEAKIQELESDISNLEKDLANWEFLKSCYGSKGIVAYKVTSKVEELRGLINKYLIELSDGRFKLDFYIEDEKLKLAIIDHGVSISIDELSSGELACVNAASLLAIRSAITNTYSSSINLLVLDEIMGVLDEFAKERLINILVKEKELCIMLVSHEYTHPLLRKLHVYKDGGISKLEEL